MKKSLIYSIMFGILATIYCTSMQNILHNTVQAVTEEISSKSACLVDYDSGQILMEKDAKNHLPVASMVKMMTILITLEEIDAGSLGLDTMITTTENASSMGGSQVFIDPYVEYSAEALLKSVIISSANDASVALAEHISGSERAFVVRMNKRAKEIGMNDTNYVNCTGLPAPEQYSCAFDSTIVMRKVIGYDLYHKYSTIWMDELTHPSGRKTELVNTNRLVRYYQGCDGGKTGSTNEAGCCLTASAIRGDMRLISCIVGAPNSQTRFNECSSLFNYGFSNFEIKKLLNQNDFVTTLPINKGKVDQVEVYPKENFSIVSPKGAECNYKVELDLPKEVFAPKKAGQKVGKALIIA